MQIYRYRYIDMGGCKIFMETDWVLSIIQHPAFRGPKRGTRILTTTNMEELGFPLQGPFGTTKACCVKAHVKPY